MTYFMSKSSSRAAVMYFEGTLLKMPPCIKVNTDFPDMMGLSPNIVRKGKDYAPLGKITRILFHNMIPGTRGLRSPLWRQYVRP